MSKRSEDDYRSELIQSLNAKLPKPYRAHNSKTITFDKGDIRAVLVGEKREFDIFIIDENFVKNEISVYSKFNDNIKIDLIDKWQSLANVQDLQFLPQQFEADKTIKGKTVKGIKQLDKLVKYEPLPERVELDVEVQQPPLREKEADQVAKGI